MRSLLDSLVSGEQSEALQALRAVLSEFLVSAEPGQGASLSTAYLKVLEAQTQVRPAMESRVDDLTAGRAARLSAAQAAATAGVGGVVGRPRSS